MNSKSKVVNNKIEKSYDNGLKIMCKGKENICNPDIEKNKIFSSKYNGILIQGDGCHPKIVSNLVENNKKSGIKIEENAKADIMDKNIIKKNYNQGILIVEGCSALISENTISQNLKANIAYGGQGSQYTRIEKNEIIGSVSEGIFVVEGHADTQIKENKVNENKDGIVLYNSEGQVKNNEIHYNQRSGILCGGQTEAEITVTKYTLNFFFIFESEIMLEIFIG